MFQHCSTLSIGHISEAEGLKERKKTYHLIMLILCLLAVVVSMLMKYDGDGLHLLGIEWPVTCALYENFGVKCALCGLTRSFCAMGAGNLMTSVNFHLLGPGIFVLVCLQIPYRIHALWASGEAKKTFRKAGIYLAIGLAGGLLINWFVYLGGRFL